MPLSHFAVNERGCGDEQYPPHLQIYCYANGVFSSRRIERATYRDLAVRYLCADTHPDHDTICAFRRQQPGGDRGRVRRGARARARDDAAEARHVDGTHLKASKDKNLTYQRAPELRAQLRLDLDALLQKAEQTGRTRIRKNCPTRLPGGKNCCARWTKRVRNWKRAPKRAAAEQAEYERKVAARDERDGKNKGPKPKPPSGVPGPMSKST